MSLLERPWLHCLPVLRSSWLAGDRLSIGGGTDSSKTWTSFTFRTIRGRRGGRGRCWRSGNFDGVHRGHRKILDRVCRVARERGATPVVMTFDPHPPRVVRPDKAPPLLMTTAQKLAGIRGRRLQGAAIVRFTAELSRWDPESFVRSALVDWLRVAEVWVGANFLFGHDRAGNFSLLRALGARYGFKAEKIDPVRYKDFVVSSTRIRRLIGEGRVDEAGALLGHQYFSTGCVVRGDGRGRTIGFPTANLCTDNELLPPHGVYATTMTIDGDRAGHRSPMSACVRRWTHRAQSLSRRTSSTSTATCTAIRFVWASSSGCATNGRSTRWTPERPDRGRLRTGPRALQPPFTVESSRVGFRIPLSLSGSPVASPSTRCWATWPRTSFAMSAARRRW